MPARPSRNNNARSNKQSTPFKQPQQPHRTSPPLSPPTQLPTPLPEEFIQGAGHRSVIMEPDYATLAGLGLAFDDDSDITRGDGDNNMAHLIDFDTPPTLADESSELDMESSAATYRSPPYREAHLPPQDAESPSPLPVPPRYMNQAYYDPAEATGSDDRDASFAGHTREPTLPRSSASPTAHRTRSASSGAAFSPSSPTSFPTPSQSRPTSRYASTSSTFESLSRTIRGYVPSSVHIPVPTAAPSPPLVSRPVVSVSRALFGAEGGASQSPGYGGAEPQREPYGHRHPHVQGRRQVEQQEYERDYEREQTDDSSASPYYGYGYGYAQSPPPPTPSQLTPHSPQPTHAVHSRSRSSGEGQQHALSSPISPQLHSQHQQPTRSFPGSGLAQAMRRGAAAGFGVASRSTSTSTSTANPKGHGRTVSAGSGSGIGQGQGARQGRGLGQPDVVTWARWDVLNERRILLLAYASRLQMWDAGDLSSVSELLNLNFDTPEWSLMLDGVTGSSAGVQVVHASILPSKNDHRGGGMKDGSGFGDVRPLLGILMESADEDERELEPRSTFVIYSLCTHQVVKLLPLPGLSHTFVPNENFVVISTTTPPTLHILSSTTFHTLHTISSSSLEPFAAPPLASHSSSSSIPSSAIFISSAISATTYIHPTLSNKSVSSHGLSIDNNNTTNNGGSGNSSPVDLRPARPHPVFALSTRLLAYATPSPAHQSSPSLLAVSSKASRRLSSSSTGSGLSHTSSSLSSSPFGLGIGKITNMTQADVGHAALKVGESVFSGMKFLGGMALEAAKSRVAPVPATGPEGRVGAYGRPSSHGDVSAGGTGGPFISRSAPDNPGVEEAAQILRERRYSNTSNVSGWDQRVGSLGTTSSSGGASPHPHLVTVAPHTKLIAENGHYVTVVDLSPLLSDRKDAQPRKVDLFNASRSQMIVKLKFAGDGTSIAAVLRNGHSVRVFKLCPAPSVMLWAQAAAAAAVLDDHGGVGDDLAAGDAGRSAAQIYELHRGRTTAVVEGVDWTKDGRWFGVSTRNRTVHIFPVNPYGGKPDIWSHVEGRVGNVEVTEPRQTTVVPLARLRGSKHPSSDYSAAPLAFTFLSPSDLSLSPDLLFPFATPSITNSPTFSSPKLKRGTHYQDVLVFDPVDGILSLRRLTIEKRAVREQGLSSGMAASVQALAVTSISLPGMGGAGRLSSSPSNPVARRISPSSRGADPPVELVARENVEATWNLNRAYSWSEIKRVVEPRRVSVHDRRSTTLGGDWLAEGEITTCSGSTRVLPRSLYLSHQFSFHTLGEDYHALIRRSQFDISGHILEVRKAVEISAYSSGGGESSFVEGFSSPRDIRRVSSSFDEPIASAISGSYDSSNLPAILPMYPNGVSASKPKSFRNSIPIRTMAGIGDGVTEGIGRIRREMHKARSPQLVARSDSSLSGPVPLEFDEEDEDFLSRDMPEIPSHGTDSSIPRDTSRENASAESGSLLVTPSNSITQHLMDAGVVGSLEDIWNGWDPQDKLAIEEAEQYDEIAAVGFVDDEPKNQPLADASSASKRKGRQKRR